MRETGFLSSAFFALEETIPDFLRKCKRNSLPQRNFLLRKNNIFLLLYSSILVAQNGLGVSSKKSYHNKPFLVAISFLLLGRDVYEKSFLHLMKRCFTKNE
jgi:hypothetical protein